MPFALGFVFLWLAPPIQKEILLALKDVLHRADMFSSHQVTREPLSLRERKVGIIGLGRIGKAIAKRAALGFGMNVVFFNRSQVPDPGVEARQLGSIAEVAKAADVLVVAVPANPETHHLMNAEVFAAMKPTAHFINIARGEVVDEAALIAALQAGEIAGAGLDVTDPEPMPADHPLLALPNVVVLPHIGSASVATRTKMAQMAADNLIAGLRGDRLPNCVNPQVYG